MRAASGLCVAAYSGTQGFRPKVAAACREKSAKTKPKIQGFPPTDSWPAVRLFSTPAENTRPSDKAQQPRVRGQRSVVKGRFRGPTRIVSDVGPPNSHLRGAWLRKRSGLYAPRIVDRRRSHRSPAGVDRAGVHKHEKRKRFHPCCLWDPRRT